MLKTIAFHSNQLSLTGTETALFDYAKGNEEILGNKSIVLFNRENKNNHPAAIEKFSNRFDVVAYDNFLELDQDLKKFSATLMYMIKSGKNDNLISRQVPTMVHAVFPTNPLQAHGASYAFVSEWLSRRCSANCIPSVPHIVELPKIEGNLRTDLGIQNHEKVIGSYGGQYNFDIADARSAVRELAVTRAELRFLFMNTEPFIDHANVIFLPGNADVSYKVKFINTCDAMLHGRRLGESFGLACAEFSIRNKPIITYKYNKHTHHHDVLAEHGRYFSDKKSLISIIDSIDPVNIKGENWDCYSDKYNRVRVMELFDRHLIFPALNNPRLDKPQLPIDASALSAYFQLKWSMFLNSQLHR